MANLWVGTGLENGFRREVPRRGSISNLPLEPVSERRFRTLAPLSNIEFVIWSRALRADFGERLTEGLGQFLNFESVEKIFVTTPLSLPRHF
jgi:hypothetical protein